MTKKKVFSAWIASLLLVSGTIGYAGATEVAPKTTVDYKDLTDVDAALKAKIDALLSKGIFEGVGDDSFGIDENMTRAQFAKVLTSIYDVKVDDRVTSSSFSDVKADDAANGWAVQYIEAAKKAGLLVGMPDNTFYPGKDVTIGELATGLVKGLGVKPDPTGSPWYADAVKQAIEKKVLPEGTDGSKTATRADLVVGAYGGQQAYQELKKDELAPSSSPKPSPEPSPSPSPEPSSSPDPDPTPDPPSQPTDTTPPSFAATYPKVGAAQADGSKQVQLLLQADESGTAYYVAVNHNASAPTVAQVMAGKDAYDNAALDAGFLLESANVQVSVTTSALPADAANYDVYIVLQDALGNASSTPTMLVVTTPAAAASQLTVTDAVYVNNATLQVTFNMAVDETTAQDAQNYLLMNMADFMGVPANPITVVLVSPNVVQLAIDTSSIWYATLQPGDMIQISVSNVKDSNDNVIQLGYGNMSVQY